jgi:DNA-3-methyladenine glycosylase
VSELHVRSGAAHAKLAAASMRESEPVLAAIAKARENRPEPLPIRRLSRSELPQETLALTQFLIGKIVVRETPAGRIAGRIVEAEGYPPGDPAGHHFRGPTPRIRSMYMAPGHAYIFFNYGNHFMLNVSSEPEGRAGGILIRGLEPLEGIELMQKNRGTTKLLDMTRGPGRIAAALEIDRRHDGVDLTQPGPLWLGELDGNASDVARKNGTVHIRRTVRIGISRAANKLFRFYEPGNPFVSGPKRLLHSGRKRATKKDGNPREDVTARRRERSESKKA